MGLLAGRGIGCYLGWEVDSRIPFVGDWRVMTMGRIRPHNGIQTGKLYREGYLFNRTDTLFTNV
jgi:hypothetical protein